MEADWDEVSKHPTIAAPHCIVVAGFMNTDAVLLHRLIVLPFRLLQPMISQRLPALLPSTHCKSCSGLVTST